MTLPDPICLNVILCDTVIEDKRTGKKTLVGVFNEILVTRLPAQHDCMFLFVSLTNCRGQHDVTIQISREVEEGEQTIVQINGQINGQNPVEVVDLVFELRGVPIASAGVYHIDVNAVRTGRRLAQRQFHVRQIAMPPAPPESPNLPPYESLS